MQLAPFLSRLIGIFAILSVFFAPMAMPSHAAAANGRSTAPASDKHLAHMTISHVGIAHMGNSAMAASAAMEAKAIPCCPGENRGPANDCGKSCPMAVLCMAKLLPAPPLAKDFVPIRLAVTAMQVPRDDLWRDLLPDPPPPEPPRS